jgi:tRNA1Val (adenine37-N6)-methyltransferase
MPNQVFHFKQFSILQDKCAMKVGTDAVLLGSWIKTANENAILDIGTGTGLLALMLAQKSSCPIDAIDVDENACLQANENANLSKWANRIHVSQISLQHFSEIAEKKYDLIVSNPPYFEDSTKAFEEKRTLARHNDLLPYNELLEGVLKLLSQNGKFYVILPAKEGESFKVLAEQKKLFLSKLLRVRTKEDKTTEKRWIMQFEIKPKGFSEESIVIEKSNRHEYTQEYIDLTKDYYLHF